jgi:hypothetical protein
MSNCLTDSLTLPSSAMPTRFKAAIEASDSMSAEDLVRNFGVSRVNGRFYDAFGTDDRAVRRNELLRVIADWLYGGKAVVR